MNKRKKTSAIIIILIIIVLIILGIVFFPKNKTANATNLDKAKQSKAEVTKTNAMTSLSNNEKLTAIKECNIYKSPDDNSPVLCRLGTGEKVVGISIDKTYAKVIFSTMNSSETGYVKLSDFTPSKIIPNNFNDLTEPSNVKKVEYGKSGMGRPLYYYQIGNGQKILLMTFEIHGYEDAWAQDGFELTKIAEYLISNLSKEDAKNGNLNGWSVCIVPSANPDGLLDGHTNYGPGRSQITKKIDINRDFPGPGFIPTATVRNNTDGDVPLKAPEAQALANLANKLMKESNGNLAVVDTHGWLDMSSGAQGLSNYFDKEFNLDNKVIHEKYYGGYWVGYAKMIGAQSTIIELPDPIIPANISKYRYDQKMLNAVNSLIKTYNFQVN